MQTSLNYSHSLDEGISGGPNCIGCHDTGGLASGGGKLINATAMNESFALHSSLNTGATNSSSIPAQNKKCWACHGNGSEPSNEHPANYDTPYQCVNCHVPGFGQNLNFTPSSIPTSPSITGTAQAS